MEQIVSIERPGLLTRMFFRIGERMFGQVPTPERLMAHRLPLMLGLGGLYGAIEWFGKIDAQLCALLNVQVAALYGRALLNRHPSRRWRESGCLGRETH
jgi:hypothetical protein